MNANSQQGNAMIGVLFLLAMAMLISEGMLDSAATNSKTRAVVNTQARYYYQVEETLNGVVGWLQSNSQYMVSGFSAANFNNNFDLGSPSLGDNEGEHFGVPTLIKMNGTNNSVMLSNNDFFGESAFPNLTHISNGTTLNPIQAFQNANIGPANARVVLVWARETNGNYEPIFRVDVVTGNNPDRGVHSYSFVQSTLITTGGSAPGFYGRDWLTLNTPNNDCYSYSYAFNAPGSWNQGAPRSNCPVASNGMITTSADIYGTAQSLISPGVTLAAPGGNVSGEICEDASCHSYSLPNHGTWAGHCPTNNGNVTISSNTTWAAGGCWDTVTINNNRTLTLTDTVNPYYIRHINYQGNFARLSPTALAQGEDIEIYVEQVGNNHFNGNRIFNGSNAPHQTKLYYIGNNALTLNGTAIMRAVVESSYAPITVSGNFNFYGAIRAPNLLVTGNARINYDEALSSGSPVLSNMAFSVKKSSQRYR